MLIFTYDFNRKVVIGSLEFDMDFGFLNSLQQNIFGKIVITICTISAIGIFIIDILFSGNCDYYIDILTKKIHYSDGKWKFKREINIDFDKIKNVVLIENMVTGEEGNKIYSYQIDVYDAELNAYKLYVLQDYDMANNIAKTLGEIVEAEVIDWTHIENYEGFIKRIL